jgi:hypothetical protein
MMKKYFLQIVTFFIALFCFGCCFNAPPQKTDMTWEKNQLIKIATQLGVAQSRASQLNMRELITEIEIKINETAEYYSGHLSEEEKKQINDLLYGEDRILKTLESYELFIKKINNRRIIILPENKSE